MYLDTDDSREMIKRNEVVICDWDNVIQNIDIPWLVNVYLHKDLFKDYFDEDKLNIHQEDYLLKVLGRQEYYLDKWLLKDGIEELPKDLKDKFMSLYIDDEEFYNKCRFTSFAETLALLVEQKFCKELIFLSHVPNGMNGYDKRKQLAFEKYKQLFNLENNKKISLVMLDGSESKSEWVQKNKPYYTTAVDDRFDIINDYVKNRKTSKGVFILPRLGYNAPMDRFLTDDEKLKYIAYANVIKYVNPF